MSYYVIWPDGRKFGPADAPTLAQWVKEGRIDESTDIEDAVSGQVMKMADLADLGVSWEEPAPMPPELSSGDHEVQQAIATDRPVGDTQFEIPQEFPMGSDSPYPVESYYKKGKGDLSTAWALIGIGFVVFFIPCCGLSFVGLALVPVGIYYADKAMKAGEPNAKTARTVGIVALALQILLMAAYFIFIFAMMAGSFTTGRP